MKETVITLQIQKAAKRVGIRNASHLSELTGMSTNTTYSMWNGTCTRIDLTSLALLCDVLRCGVSAILVRSEREVSVSTARNRPERITQKGKQKGRVIQL